MIRYDTIRLFSECKTKVHVSCDGKFYNGTVLEVNEDKGYIILIDTKFGEVPIMVEEILSIEPYIVR